MSAAAASELVTQRGNAVQRLGREGKGEMMAADITQITTPDNVMFSANSAVADEWMRTNYGPHNLYFDLPSDQAGAIAFKAAAAANGFTIDLM